MTYKNEYGTEFAVREHGGKPMICCLAEGAEEWAVSNRHGLIVGDATAAEDMEAALAEYAGRHGWIEASDVAADKAKPCTPDEIQKIIEAIPTGHAFAQIFKGICAKAKTRKDIDALLSVKPCPNSNGSSVCDVMFNRDNLFLDKGNTFTCHHDSAGVYFCVAERQSYISFLAVLDTLWQYAEKYDLIDKPIENEPDENPVPEAPADTDALATTSTAEVAAFDFGALSTEDAALAAEDDVQFDLHAARMRDEYAMTCIYLAHIHDLTAKAGRYGGGTWTAWYTSKGLSATSVKRMLEIGDNFKWSNLDHLKNLSEFSRSELLEISTSGSEPVKQAALAGDSEQVKELLAQLKAKDDAILRAQEVVQQAQARAETAEETLDIKAQRTAMAERKAEEAQKQLADEKERYEELFECNHNFHTRAEKAESERAMLLDEQGLYIAKISEIEKERDGARAQLRDLESRPIDVAVAEPTPEQLAAIRADAERAAQAAADERVRHFKSANAELQNQLAEAERKAESSALDADACQGIADAIAQSVEDQADMLRATVLAAPLPPELHSAMLNRILTACARLENVCRSGITTHDEEADIFDN